MKISRHLAFLLLFITPVTLVFSQVQDWGNYYTGNKVSSMVLADSILWVDMESGLTRINLNSGVKEFHFLFDSIYYQEYYNPLKLSIAVNSQSETSVGFGAVGLYEYQNGDWLKYDTSNTNLNTNLFLKLKYDREDNLWLLNGWNKLAKRISRDSFEIYDFESVKIQDFSLDTANNPWVITENGIVHIAENKRIHFDTTNSPLIHNIPRSIQIDNENNLWVLDTLISEHYTSTVFLFKYDGEIWSELNSDSGDIPFNYAPKIFLIDNENIMWFVYDKQIIQYSNSQWDTILLGEYWPVTDIAVRSKGDFFLGTFGYGLLTYDNGIESTSSVSNNTIPGEDINSIVIDDSSRVWISSNAIGSVSNGITLFDDGEWYTNNEFHNGILHYDIPGGPYGSSNLFIDTKSRLWALHPFTRAFIFNGEDWGDLEDPFEHVSIEELAEDSKDSIWFLSKSSIGKIVDEDFQRVYLLDEHSYWSHFCIDANDVIWAADQARLYKCANGIVEEFNCDNSELPCSGYEDLAVDKDNVLWICGPGIIKYDGKVITQYRFNNQLEISSNLTYSVTVDDNNTKYFGTYLAGVIKFDGQNWYTINKSNSRINHNSVKSIAIDDDNIWVGTRSGVCRFKKDFQGEQFNPTEIVLTHTEEGLLFQSTVKSYPNPASITITIEFDNPEYKFYYLNIYDNLGRIVHSTDEINSNQINVDVDQYGPGIYYYKLLSEAERVESWGKFIVE